MTATGDGSRPNNQETTVKTLALLAAVMFCATTTYASATPDETGPTAPRSEEQVDALDDDGLPDEDIGDDPIDGSYLSEDVTGYCCWSCPSSPSGKCCSKSCAVDETN
jgi:hypothetical protein